MPKHRVSASSAIRWVDEWHQSGRTAALPQGGDQRSGRIEAEADFLLAAGATRLFLPPYSPDFNPIEQLFAKLKAWLRKAAARTKDALWQAITEALDIFTPAECINYFRNSGYEPE
jgi:hypothetical protein